MLYLPWGLCSSGAAPSGALTRPAPPRRGGGARRARRLRHELICRPHTEPRKDTRGRAESDLSITCPSVRVASAPSARAGLELGASCSTAKGGTEAPLPPLTSVPRRASLRGSVLTGRSAGGSSGTHASRRRTVLSPCSRRHHPRFRQRTALRPCPGLATGRSTARPFSLVVTVGTSVDARPVQPRSARALPCLDRGWRTFAARDRALPPTAVAHARWVARHRGLRSARRRSVRGVARRCTPRSPPGRARPSP